MGESRETVGRHHDGGKALPDLREMMKGLIEGGFPDLSGLRIDVRWANSPDDFARVFPYGIGRRGFGSGGADRWRYALGVDAELRSAPMDALRGVLAHELGHIRRQGGTFTGAEKQKALRAFLSGGRAPEHVVDGEREADLQAVLSGFGRELRACYRHLDDEFDYGSAEKPNGLSLGEIEVATALLEEGFSAEEVAGLVLGS